MIHIKASVRILRTAQFSSSHLLKQFMTVRGLENIIVYMITEAASPDTAHGQQHLSWLIPDSIEMARL